MNKFKEFIKPVRSFIKKCKSRKSAATVQPIYITIDPMVDSGKFTQVVGDELKKLIDDKHIPTNANFEFTSLPNLSQSGVNCS